MSKASPIRKVDCDSVDDIIDQLRGPNSVAATAAPYEWAYRGQADSSWPLIASAIRPGTQLGFLPNRFTYRSKGYGSCIEQMSGEVVAVRQFVELADRVGLPIPGMHPFFRQNGFDRYQSGPTAAVCNELAALDWPKGEMLELLAIAQHHGVPTRLLDFSYDPLVALFFASDGVSRNRETFEAQNAERLAVWAININELQRKNA